MHVADAVRAGLEDRPRRPFDVDRERALDALEFTWGRCYVIQVHGSTWAAKRRDGLGGEIEASLPDDLNRLLREDWSLKPVTLP